MSNQDSTFRDTPKDSHPVNQSRRYTRTDESSQDPVVITGIGMIASVGQDRESVWHAVRNGCSGVRSLTGLLGIPDNLLIGAPVDVEPDFPGQLKAIKLARIAAAEAMADARVDMKSVNRHRFGCAVSGHMGDTSYVQHALGLEEFIDHQAPAYWTQWLPNTACSNVANRYGLYGPRICHSVACASGLIDVLAAVNSLRDGKCDIALAGSADAFHPLFAAGFHKMRVLAQHEDPQQACRPFNVDRNGFVMGEGAAMFIMERLSHAQRRGARIYAEVLGGKMLAEAHHVTGLDAQSEALTYLITETLRRSGVAPEEIDYINAHGTGTQQNDVVESRGIRRAFGRAADKVCVSATKSMLGHLVNASGSVELAITTLALRDGFGPPTLNLTNQDPDCDLDCIPLVGRSRNMQHALKLSVAFGGHLVGVALRKWQDADHGFSRHSTTAA